MEQHARFAAALELVKYDGNSFWQTFGTFLVSQTVILGFLLASLGNGIGLMAWRPGAFGAALVGMILAVPWFAASERQRGYYRLRFAQARAAEPKDWDLVGGTAQSFSAGREVTVAGERYRLGLFARSISVQRSGGVVILTFAVVYAALALANGPWASNPPKVASTNATTQSTR